MKKAQTITESFEFTYFDEPYPGVTLVRSDSYGDRSKFNFDLEAAEALQVSLTESIKAARRRLPAGE